MCLTTTLADAPITQQVKLLSVRSFRPCRGMVRTAQCSLMVLRAQAVQHLACARQKLRTLLDSWHHTRAQHLTTTSIIHMPYRAWASSAYWRRRSSPFDPTGNPADHCPTMGPSARSRHGRSRLLGQPWLATCRAAVTFPQTCGSHDLMSERKYR